MISEFWLDKLTELINIDNFNFLNDNIEQKKVKLLNLIASFSIIFGLIYYKKTKNKSYVGLMVLALSLSVLLRPRKSNFSEVLSNSYDTGVYLVRAVNGNNSSGLNNTLYINNALNFNPGDIIALSNGNNILESNIVSNIQYTTDDNTPVLVLLNPLKNNYSKYTTRILKVSDTSPNIMPPTDANISIQQSQGPKMTDPYSMAVENYPPFRLPNMDRNDWNLENSTIVQGSSNYYQYQGQPYGDLKCRSSTVSNPMGTINVMEYDNPPTMYGTCNVGEDNNDYKMTLNQEATVSQDVNGLLFHKNNSQTQFSPVPVDTLPNDQEAFAHWCYRNPTNLVNVKYGSIFVNEPEKFKLVTKLSKASGTEGRGPGGR
jgi:hypothetical protein